MWDFQANEIPLLWKTGCCTHPWLMRTINFPVMAAMHRLIWDAHVAGVTFTTTMTQRSEMDKGLRWIYISPPVPAWTLISNLNMIFWPCGSRVAFDTNETHAPLPFRIAMSPLWFHRAIMPIKIWLHCKWILDTAPLPRDLKMAFILNSHIEWSLYINSGDQITKPMSLAHTAEKNIEC